MNSLSGMAFVMIACMSRSPSLGNGVHMPLVQLAYALIALVIVYGHSQVSEIIDNAV